MVLTTLSTDVINSTAVTSSVTWPIGIQSNELWIVITGFIIAFILAFGIGANDVANSFATSVGAKVLTLTQACILATVFETAGAILIGAKVSDTIRKGIIDITLFEGQGALLMIGNVSALAGSCVWLLVATFFKMPVSGTHSIVGATVGYALVQFGGRGIEWPSLILIVVSWFLSPILAGAVSVVLFALLKKFILDKEKPLEPGLTALPFIYALTIIINVFSVVYSGTPVLGFDKIPLWGCFVITFGSGLLAAILVRVVLVPRMKKKIQVKRLEDTEDAVDPHEGTGILGMGKNASTVPTKLIGLAEELGKNLQKYQENDGPTKSILAEPEHDSKDTEVYTERDVPIQTCPSPAESCDSNLSEKLKSVSDISNDRPDVRVLFTFLQILTAIFGSFAHGGNDVSNAVGPLIGLWLVGYAGTIDTDTSTPIWILAYGGMGISLGLWLWGRRVMETLGEDLTKITPSSGFCIEIGSALTVLIASNVGIPISTTHCKVGSVVCTGRFRSRENVQWKIFRNIIFAWLVTLPVSGFIAAAVYAGLREIWRHQ